MDNIRNLITGEPKEEEPPKETGLMDKIHGALGGGPESEKNEDALDKVIDFVQEKVLGQGPQDNENFVEQKKDKMIGDYLRGQFRAVTGRDEGEEEK